MIDPDVLALPSHITTERVGLLMRARFGDPDVIELFPRSFKLTFRRAPSR